MSIPTTRLGRTGLNVSRLALGTMTFGLQTEEAVAHQILAKAASAGVNFLDTADVYPLGGGLPTAGRTEEVLGRWLNGKRSRFIVATKAVGKTYSDAGMAFITPSASNATLQTLGFTTLWSSSWSQNVVGICLVSSIDLPFSMSYAKKTPSS